MTEKQRDHAYRQQLAQAIACLAGDADSGEQNHGVERENHYAAQETFLLGNYRENEVIVSHHRRQVAQHDLLSLAPAGAPETARADSNQRLFDVPGIVAFLQARLLAFGLGGFSGGEIAAEINPEPASLIVLELDLPVGRREQDVHQQQRHQYSHRADQPRQEPRGNAGHISHHHTDRQEHQRGAKVRLLQDEQERQQGKPDGLDEQKGPTQFVGRPAQEMGLNENKRELGQLRRLELENAQVNPAPRAQPIGADVRNQHRDQEQNREPVSDH